MRHCTNEYMRAYSHTVKGFIVRTYSNMRGRVIGQNTRAPHIYVGKPILGRDEFYAWAMQNSDFLQLFKTWEDSGFVRKLTPSINRVNGLGGYTVGNMEWLTLAENCLLGAHSPRIKKDYVSHEKPPMAKLNSVQVDEIRHFHATGVSYRKLVQKYGISKSQIARICTGNSWRKAKH